MFGGNDDGEEWGGSFFISYGCFECFFYGWEFVLYDVGVLVFRDIVVYVEYVFGKCIVLLVLLFNYGL